MGDSISLDDYSDLVGAIYDCAIQPDRWRVALGLFRDAIGACNAQISVVDLGTGTYMLSEQVGVDQYWLERQAAYVPELADMVLKPQLALELPVGVISRDTDPRMLQEMRYYKEWAKPQNIHDAMGIVAVHTPNRLAHLAAGRLATAGPYGPEDAALAERLTPHIRRAVTISDMLGLAELRTTVFDAALETLSKGIVILDSTGRVLHANAAAEAMARGDGPISIRNGVLTPIDSTARAMLERSLAACTNGEASLPGAGRGFALAGSDGAIVMAHMLPLLGGERRRQLPNGAAILFLSPDTGPAEGPLSSIAEAFDLSRTETRVLGLLVSGMDAPTVAADLGVAESTVRSHVRSLLTKTGENRITDLVSLVHKLAAPVR